MTFNNIFFVLFVTIVVLSIRQLCFPIHISHLYSILSDFYYVTWFPLENSEDVHVKQLPGDTAEEEGLVRVLIESLHPGVEYQFEITSESHQRRSRTIETKIRTEPLCTSELFIITDQEVSTSLTLRYTPTPLARSTFDTYRFMLSDPAIPVKEKAAKDHERKVTFVDLVPGRMYNISLWTVSGGVTSRPVERQDRLHPQPVANINATEITDKRITLVWDSPQGDFDSFEVTYLDAKGNLIQNFTFTNTITIGGLRPYRNYTFTVVTKAGTDQSIPKRSNPKSGVFSTRESVPGSLTSFEPIDVQPRQITFQWELPDLQANGIITGFTIQWGPKAELGKPFIPEESRHFGSEETQGTIKDLDPGQKYTFQIQAKTAVGYGPQVRKEQKMPILPPPTPTSNVFPTEIYRSMHTVTVRFRKNYFSDKNGKVLGYSIIVAEDNTKHTEGDQFLPGWRDVQKFSVWPPYQVKSNIFGPHQLHFLFYRKLHIASTGDRAVQPVQQQLCGDGGLHRGNGGLHKSAQTMQWKTEARNGLQVQGELSSTGNEEI